MLSRIALCALVATTTVASADVVVATAAKGTVTAYRITSKGIDELYTAPFTNPVDFGWSDARTLWLVNQTDAGYAVARIVDGKREPRPIPKLELAVPRESLHITSGGQVWLASCARTGDLGCQEWRHVRVDRKATSKTAPKQVIDHRATRRFSSVAAPAGYSVRLGTVNAEGAEIAGVRCRGPGKRATWPAEQGMTTVTPKQARWVRASPAVAVVDYTRTWPNTTVTHHAMAFLDCQPGEAVLLDGSLWAWRPDGAATWTVYAGARSIGTLRGEELRTPRARRARPRKTKRSR